jgi:hypothetical protein
LIGNGPCNPAVQDIHTGPSDQQVGVDEQPGKEAFPIASLLFIKEIPNLIKVIVTKTNLHLLCLKWREGAQVVIDADRKRVFKGPSLSKLQIPVVIAPAMPSAQCFRPTIFTPVIVKIRPSPYD